MSDHPAFFIDRSLGRKHLADALRAHGLTVHTMASVYGERAAQELDDERWLADAGHNGWVVLMKDDAISRRPAERDALVAAQVRASCLTNAQLRAVQQSARFVDNVDRILRQARKPGPYIYGVYDGYIKLAHGDQAAHAGVQRPLDPAVARPQERLAL